LAIFADEWYLNKRKIPLYQEEKRDKILIDEQLVLL
jgi:hypothetical protein